MLLKHVNGHWSTCMVVNSDLPVLIHTQSRQLPFQECWSIRIIHKLPDATLTMSTTNLKRHINLFNPNSSQYQHLVTSLGLPYPYFPFSALAAPANTLVSLLLQLMQATVLAEKSILYLIFYLVLSVTVMFSNLSQLGIALFPSF